MGTRCADHVTPLYPQKLALTSPTGGGRSVGIFRVRTKATEFSLVVQPVLQHPCHTFRLGMLSCTNPTLVGLMYGGAMKCTLLGPGLVAIRHILRI